MMNGYIHSFQSMGTLDGPGVRCVIFMQGCPLRCVYCHNPDTWKVGAGEQISTEKLMSKISRYKSYITNGGVTVSGGEALLQAEFVTELFTMCRKEKIHTALDTSGCMLNPQIESLLDVTDLCLLDIKMTTEEDYITYTKQSLSSVLTFLSVLEQKQISTWIRHVVVPGINDNEENIARLNEITNKYSCIKQVELLPFRRLCTEKYDKMGIAFPLADTPEAPQEVIGILEKMLDKPKM